MAKEKQNKKKVQKKRSKYQRREFRVYFKVYFRSKYRRREFWLAPISPRASARKVSKLSNLQAE